MNRQFGRLLLAGVCWGAVASAAPAQSVGSPDDAAAHPSHRLLGGVSDLAGAEDLLALRLHHTHDVQEVQDLVKSLLDNDEYRRMLKDKFNGLNDDDFKSLKETIQKNPQLLDDPKLHDLLKKVEKFKKDGGDLNSLPKETKDSVLDLAKDFIKQNPTDPASSDPMTGGPMSHIPPGASQPAVPPSPPASSDKFSPSPHEASQPNWVTHDLVQGMTGLIKDIDRTPEGEALRTAALQELAKMESSSSSGLADFLKNILSSDQAAWLAHAGKSSSGSGLDGWDLGSAASAAPSVGGSSDGLMDGVVWIVALGLLVAAGWMAVAVARRQAASRRKPGRGRQGRGRCARPRYPRARI